MGPQSPVHWRTGPTCVADSLDGQWLIDDVQRLMVVNTVLILLHSGSCLLIIIANDRKCDGQWLSIVAIIVVNGCSELLMVVNTGQ